jgi:very-short-patch-repair endonuclease
MKHPVTTSLSPDQGIPSPPSFGGEGQGEGEARGLRRNPTWAEKKLWQLLRNRRFVGFKFRRQHPVGPYVLDFHCVSARLAIELDGDVHGRPDRASRDARKDEYLAGKGIKVLRFWNVELLENQDGVLTTILLELEHRTANPHPDPLPSTTRERGTGQPDEVRRLK